MTKAKIAALHHDIANIRNDFLQKQSTIITKTHGIIVLENLKVVNMTKSAKGTIDEPGKNVAAKSALNRSILDQGWGAFEHMVVYKLGWLGGELIKVPAPYTSQTCSVCGNVNSENRQNQATFICTECGHKANADTNAAINIRKKGLLKKNSPPTRQGIADKVCGGDLAGELVKQKPTEATL